MAETDDYVALALNIGPWWTCPASSKLTFSSPSRSGFTSGNASGVNAPADITTVDLAVTSLRDFHDMLHALQPSTNQTMWKVIHSARSTRCCGGAGRTDQRHDRGPCRLLCAV